MNISDISKCSFRNKFEYRMSILSDKKLKCIQRILIKRICKAEADTLDFYDYKKTEKKFRKKELNEDY